MQDNMYKLGMSLVKRELIQFQTLEQALKLKKEDPGLHAKTLAEILVENLEVPYDLVFSELASYYGYKKMVLGDEMLDNDRIDFIRKIIERVPDNIRKAMQNERFLVFRHEGSTPLKVILVSVDPTNKNIPVVARALGAKRFEIFYVSSADFEKLEKKVFKQENEFLKMINDSQHGNCCG